MCGLTSRSSRYVYCVRSLAELLSLPLLPFSTLRYHILETGFGSLEEHFRKSLGEDYSKLFNKTDKQPQPDNSKVTIKKREREIAREARERD